MEWIEKKGIFVSGASETEQYSADKKTWLPNGFQNIGSAFFEYFPNEVLAVGPNTDKAGYQMFVRG
jgi:hypothetical protein